nr:hypothetical protein [Tanacetum cinerariifolium]
MTTLAEHMIVAGVENRPHMLDKTMYNSWQSRDDPIACLNKAMAFMSTMMASHFPSTNNQLRISSNPINQATIQDGRVTIQQVQGRQGQSFASTGTKGNVTSSKGNIVVEQAFWLSLSNLKSEQPDVTQTPIEIEVPKELPKVTAALRFEQQFLISIDDLLDYMVYDWDLVYLVFRGQGRFIFLIVRNGRKFKYWKVGLVVWLQRKSESRGSFVSFREMITSQLQRKL